MVFLSSLVHPSSFGVRSELLNSTLLVNAMNSLGFVVS
jgi:hypothetical protein